MSTSSSSNRARPRAPSEDVPELLRDLLKEVPANSQTILSVTHVDGLTKSQKKAEEKFLANKNVREELSGAENSFDYQYLRKLLKAAPCDAFYLGRRARDVKDRPNVEVSNRCYEEQFLREPKQNERPCAKGSACEGLKLTNSDEGFVLREYLLPSMYKSFLEKKTLPQFPQLCLLCRRAECSRLYVGMRSDEDSTGSLISDIRNIAAPGEYSLDQMLLPCISQKVGLFDPIVHHCRKLYSVSRISGIRYVLQSGYDKPSSAAFLIQSPLSE